MIKNKIKTVFIGTPDFSVPILRALINDDFFDVVGVITQPDKKVGREQTVAPPPVKVEADKSGIAVWQPESIKRHEFKVDDLDLIVVAAYAQILPERILNFPKFGAVNVHASLLPRHRGASCIQAAILAGDKKTGLTVMKMDKGLDTGPILAQKEVEVWQDDTTESVFDKLSELSGDFLIRTLKLYIDGKIVPEIQDNGKATYAGILKKEDGRIDWTRDAVFLERFIRAMHSWPGAFTGIRNQELGIRNLKILEVDNKILDIDKYKIGEVFLDNGELAAQCGKGALVIKRLQMAGKRSLKTEDFLKGNDVVGSVLT